MFKPRRIESFATWRDVDGTKIYTVSASGADVEQAEFLPRLMKVKASKPISWKVTPSFAIFHEGSSAKYLVLAWWGNDNELFTSVSVRVNGAWVEDPDRYSFCVWDLEIIWGERNIFIDTMCCVPPGIEKYREQRLVADRLMKGR